MNVLTADFADALLRGTVDWSTQSLCVYLLDDTYVFDRETAPNPGNSAVVAGSATLTGLSVEGGWAKAPPAYFPSLYQSKEVTQAILSHATEPNRTPLIFIDTASGFPFMPVAPLWLAWESTGIFRL